MTNAPNLNALLAAQIAAEDAVLAQGLEVWSVADPATGEVVLHVSQIEKSIDLKIGADWLRGKLAVGLDDPPCGLMACSPEIYMEMMAMTTQVQIKLTQQHIPVVVEIVRSDGSVSPTETLRDLESVCTEYVHSGQTLRVREMTPQEMGASSSGA